MVKRFGPYELLRRLGAGATTEVFLVAGKVRDQSELLALKLLLPHMAEDERLRRLFTQEARAAQGLRHRNLVEVLDAGEAEGRPYLAMEYVRGWPLSAVQKRLKERGQALPVSEACALVREAALGLHHAHEVAGPDGEPLGLIHRGVCPSNLLLREDGRVKVADLGLAAVTASALQISGLKGKLSYLAPEQLSNARLDRRVDVFALGAVLWELLGKKRLEPTRDEAKLPGELAQVLLAALEREPTRRTATALELADALKLFAAQDAPRRLAERLASLFDTPSPDEASPRDASADDTEKQIQRPSGRHRPAAARPEARHADTVISPPPAKALVEPPAARARGGEEPSRPRGFWPTGEISVRVLLAKPAHSTARRLLIALGGIAAAALLVAIVAVAARYVSRSPPSPARGAAAASSGGAEAGAREPARGTLRITSSAPALVREGDQELGMTPLTVELAAGKHRLELSTPDGRRSRRLDVTLRPGEELTRHVQLRRARPSRRGP